MGVTGPTGFDERALRTPEGFRRFLDGHAAMAHLLRDAKPLDQGSYTQIAYSTERYFSPDRWGLTGEAATSADPLYSPGTDFIAHENDFLTELIRRDFAGESAAELAERCDLYDRFMAFRQEATLLLYRNQYESFGSFELGKLKWDFDIGCYFNLWVSPYLRDEHLDPRWLRRQLRMAPLILHGARRTSTRCSSGSPSRCASAASSTARTRACSRPASTTSTSCTRSACRARAARCSRRPRTSSTTCAGARCICWGPTRRVDPEETLSLSALLSAKSLG